MLDLVPNAHGYTTYFSLLSLQLPDDIRACHRLLLGQSCGLIRLFYAHRFGLMLGATVANIPG